MAITIKAKKVKRGHSIPGLDNAYVVEVEKNVDIYGDSVRFTFHDAEGNEGYLTVDKNHPITVDQDEPQWVGW